MPSPTLDPRGYRREQHRRSAEKRNAARRVDNMDPEKVIERRATRRRYYRKDIERSRSLSLADSRKYFHASHRGMSPETETYCRVTIDVDPCSYCDKPGGVRDHIVPFRGEGTADFTNVTSSCMACNFSKRHTPLLVWLARR
jgi:hypothetical protein